MPASDIVIKGAREHNLRDVSLVLPRNQLICLTGVSGSGKSSLAFDTLYAEGQRRYVESLSSYARHFLGQMPKPDVDYIGGLSPSISISQKSSGNNPRSTVGTITEIYDYLRVLFARVGQGHCPKCEQPITAQSREEILVRILQLPEGSKLNILAPLIRQQKGEYKDLFEDLLKQGFVRARVDGAVVQLNSSQSLDRQMRHDIEVVVDRLTLRPDIRPRLSEAVETALKMGGGNLIVALDEAGETKTAAIPVNEEEGEEAAEEEVSAKSAKKQRRAARAGDMLFSSDYACTKCGLSFEPPSPQLFSFNSPQGMCADCDGLGVMYSLSPELLVPNPKLSFKDGALELIGPWHELGRWRRHIYQGVADTIERKHQWESGTLLETPWNKLTNEQQRVWLYGTGKEHITYTWRGGQAPMMYGGKFEGIIPEFAGKHKTSKSKMQQKQLEKYMSMVGCPTCHGERLVPQARAVRITTSAGEFEKNPVRTLPQICNLAVSDASAFFAGLQLTDTQQIIASEVLKEIRTRLGFLIDVGLDYLSLDRTAPTLSGGESQRIRLAGQIGSGLVGVLYILDEPSIGLHPRDNDRLLATLRRLRDMGNTVIVVEHDEDTIWAADQILDFGPGPGVRGGELVAQGKPGEVLKAERSVTGKFMSGEREIAVPQERRPLTGNFLKILGAEQNNLKNVDVEIPLGSFVCVTGVSGSGKSSLVSDIVVETLHRDLNKGEGNPGKHRAIEGMEHLDKLIAIDQTPIGRTPRSNPGTYIKLFDEIRDLFTQLPEAKRRGFKPGRFSFNVEGGRCESCEGNGSTKLEMDFLADVWVTCPVCEGKRFSRETLQVRFKDKSIADVLDMDVQQLLELFANVPNIHHRLQTLHDVGLDYIKLGQPSPTLSGGEAQRIKLARELVKKSTGKTLYLLDEPTTGLHFADIQLLLKVLHNFVDAGNTVLVVEHNLDVIKTADWIIDMGPEGGAAGGRLLAAGTPEDIVKCKESYTGRALKKVLDGSAAKEAREKAYAALHPVSETKTNGKKKSRNDKPLEVTQGPPELATHIIVRGAKQHNLKDVSAKIERDKMTVFCGPSGSGKSSLAMDTIYAEGQRRYVESLSSYARQFVAQMQKPVVDHIDGLSPAIAIEQKNLGHTPRSTVGTVTEIYDYLRIMIARLGQLYCPACDIPVGTQSADQVVDTILAETPGAKLYLMAPVEIEVGQQYGTLWESLRAKGYNRVRVNGASHNLDAVPEIDRRRKHKVEVVLDRVIVKEEARSRIAGSVEQALALGKGVMHVAYAQDDVPENKWKVVPHSQHLACKECNRSFEPLTPHSFSFNSPLGWCPSCEGLGVQTGANPAALLSDPKLTLAQGALALWPDLTRPYSQAMLEALAAGTGVPLDVPFDQLPHKQRRTVLYGAEEQWFDVLPPGATAKKTKPMFRFQFKGLYPALEEASKLSPLLRIRLEQLVADVECSTCGGSRLRDDASAVKFRGQTIGDIGRMPLGHLQSTIANWNLTERERKIAGELLREITGRLAFLLDVGLDYLSLSRPAATLSNGEAQRIRLASQLGSGLCGVLYVLDEPTIGLHPRDNTRLLGALHKLRDLGNTLIVVEHDREVIEHCDHLLDFGPRAGRLGGEIVADAHPNALDKQPRSVTGPYLSGRKAIPVPITRRMGQPLTAATLPTEEAKPAKPTKKKKATEVAATSGDIDRLKPGLQPQTAWIEVLGARHNNLRNVDVRIPLGTLTAVTGPSGSGKSTLIEDVLCAAASRQLHRKAVIPGQHDKILGLEYINKVIPVDQQPLGNSPTSNPATFTGCFELIRTLFSQLPEAKVRGYSGRRFSFNVPGGRCEACEGNGQKRIEMHFLPDVWVECDVCRGKRYNPETLAVMFHGHSISDVLDMTCGDALKLFENIPKIRRIMQTLCDVGLDYLTLGQPAPTLSGGEAQRVKLAAELSRPDTGRTLYLLDEPTTGLHFDDLAKLLEVLQRLVDLGNTVVLIEHNLDIIKSCDWMIDMGPDAGEGGGQVVAFGTPDDVVARHLAMNGGSQDTKQKAKKKSSPQLKTELDPNDSGLYSHTAAALAPVLLAGPFADRKKYDPNTVEQERQGDLDITEVGKSVKMPWEADGRKWHTESRVGRTGEPCKWDGRILSEVVDKIHELGEFSETDWSERSVVEIAAAKKSDGWFFHAITGETWLLKLKFRVYKGTFKREALQERIQLKSLNELADLPIYGNEPRVKVKTLQGPWQEVEVRAHSFEEIDTPEFWQFIADAVEGFFKFTEKATVAPEDVSPWKILGQKWHLLRKGFPPGRNVEWKAETLEELCELLKEVAPGGDFLWSNQQLVRIIVPQQREPWATIYTKRPQSLLLVLNGPKGKFALGGITNLGSAREFDDLSKERDVIKLHFANIDQVHMPELRKFLTQHLASLGGASKDSALKEIAS